MNERVQNYVDRIFADYQDSQQLQELKEEIKANLLERIEDSIAGGCSGEEAFQLAIKELGDVSEVAEQISLNTKYEVFEQMYTKKPLPKKHALGYTVAVGIVLFGLITAPIIYFLTGSLFLVVSSAFPFAVIGISAIVFLGLIHETHYHYAMKPIRAGLYALATAILTSGVFTSFIVYLERMGLKGEIESLKLVVQFHNEPLFLAISTLLPFLIPAICLFVFLGLTEKDRTKPNIWSDYYKSMNADDETAVHQRMAYDNLLGALWIFSVALFLTIGFLFSWKYSLIVFIFTIGVLVLMEAFLAKKRIKS